MWPFRWITERIKARRRGERRIAPMKVTGRVYEKKLAAGGHQIGVIAKTEVTARRWSEKDQRWYRLDLTKGHS